MLLICFVCFLSFVSAAQDFSGYQSDGICSKQISGAVFAPPGLGPGLGYDHRRHGSLFLLQWDGSASTLIGLVKLLVATQSGAI